MHKGRETRCKEKISKVEVVRESWLFQGWHLRGSFEVVGTSDQNETKEDKHGEYMKIEVEAEGT